MKTGLFGGAFNPIHLGHLQLAGAFAESLSLDRIIFIPTAIPPHKTARYLAPAQDRLKMLSLVTAENPRYEVTDMEFRREGKSYSYDTICELKECYPEDTFYLLIGSDQFFYFPKWYKAEEILRLVTVCTAAREDGEYQRLLAFRAQYDYMKDTVVENFNVFPVSSSEIRDRVKNGRSLCGLVPTAVENYIKENKLYV